MIFSKMFNISEKASNLIEYIYDQYIEYSVIMI